MRSCRAGAKKVQRIESVSASSRTDELPQLSISLPDFPRPGGENIGALASRNGFQSRACRMINSRLGDNEIHWNIVCVGMQIFQAENFERNTDSEWTRVHGDQRAIEITAAVPQAKTKFVEADHGDDQGIHCYRIGIVRYRNIISADFHGRSPPPLAETERLMFIHHLRERRHGAMSL